MRRHRSYSRRVTSGNVFAADIATADSDTDVTKVPCAKARAPTAVITASQSNEGSKIRRPLTAKAVKRSMPGDGLSAARQPRPDFFRPLHGCPRLLSAMDTTVSAIPKDCSMMMQAMPVLAEVARSKEIHLARSVGGITL